MAFPSVLQASTFQFDSSNASSFEVSRPSGLTNDNLLIVCFACDGQRTITMTADGLTHLDNSAAANGVSLRCAYRKIDGTEPEFFTITTSGNERACAIVYEIQGAADPATDDPDDVTYSNGTSATPDPPGNFTGSVEDNLWVAVVGVDRDRTIDSFPSNMTAGSSEQNVDGGGANSCSIGSDTHEDATTAFNPATFGISSSDGWVGTTIKIPPAAVVAPVGTGAPTLEPFAVTAIGEMPAEAVGAPAFEVMDLTASGVMQPSGIGALTLEIEELAAEGVEKFLATGVPTLEVMDLAATGVEKFLAVGAPTLEPLALAAIGEQPYEGAGAPELEIMELAAVGEVPFEGVGALELQIEELAAVGEQPFTGVGAPELEVMELATVGTAGDLPVGTGAPTLEIMELNADGVMEADGTGAPTLGSFLLAAVGAQAGVALGSFWPRMRRRRRPGH